jgi:hypothetical protein
MECPGAPEDASLTMEPLKKKRAEKISCVLMWHVQGLTWHAHAFMDTSSRSDKAPVNKLTSNEK